jgi:hypothetical protein
MGSQSTSESPENLLETADRLKDLVDVLELVRYAKLSPEFAELLDPFVREKYLELLRAAQTEDLE